MLLHHVTSSLHLIHSTFYSIHLSLHSIHSLSSTNPPSLPIHLLSSTHSTPHSSLSLIHKLATYPTSSKPTHWNQLTQDNLTIYSSITNSPVQLTQPSNQTKSKIKNIGLICYYSITQTNLTNRPTQPYTYPPNPLNHTPTHQTIHSPTKPTQSYTHPPNPPNHIPTNLIHPSNTPTQ